MGMFVLCYDEWCENKKKDWSVINLKKFGKLFTKHYAIERFGIMFLTVVCLMIVNLSFIVVKKVQYDKQELSGKVIYTQQFAMSKTGTAGTVQGVYTNEKQDTVFVLLGFESMSDIPVDADSYEIYLTGSTPNFKPTELECRPSGSLYVFGNTGYMGIVLENSGKFPSQILDLVIRSKSDFKGGNNAGSESSFERFNQARVYLNPGGEYAEKAKFLEKDKWSVFDAYEEMVSRPRELEVRDTLRKDLIAMRDTQLVMDEYTKRITGSDMGLVEPKVPSDIADDVIYGMDLREDSKEHLVWSKKDNAWYSESHDGVLDESYVDLFLDTDFLVPGGYDFTWQTGSVKEGYLEDLTGSEKASDWNAYFAQHEKDKEERDVSFDVSKVTFTYTDGSEYGFDTGEGDGVQAKKDARVKESVQTLLDAWTTFYDTKTQYQTVDLPELLHIEADAYDVETSYTVNTDKDGSLLILY